MHPRHLSWRSHALLLPLMLSEKIADCVWVLSCSMTLAATACMSSDLQAGAHLHAAARQDVTNVEGQLVERGRRRGATKDSDIVPNHLHLDLQASVASWIPCHAHTSCCSDGLLTPRCRADHLLMLAMHKPLKRCIKQCRKSRTTYSRRLVGLSWVRSSHCLPCKVADALQQVAYITLSDLAS